MIDKNIPQKDELLLAASKLEFKGETEKAIEKYQEAFDKNCLEAGLKIAFIYFINAILYPNIEKNLILACKWLKIIYPYNKNKSLDSLVYLWEKYNTKDSVNEILQFIIDRVKNNDEYAKEKWNYIKEKIK